MIRVLLADNQAVVRAGLRMILESHDGLEVIGEAGDGRQAIALTRELQPDVVLMDIRMPDLDGIEATPRIVRDGLSARVPVLTTYGLDENVYDALAVGASGFLVKTARRTCWSRRSGRSPPGTSCSAPTRPVGWSSGC